MAKITEEQFNSIKEYLQQCLQKDCEGAYGYTEMIPLSGSYQDYIDQLPKGKNKAKVEVSLELEEQWTRFWKLWPSTKSLGKWKSNAKMKPAEHLMKKKWVNAMVKDKISAEDLYKAAEIYLKTAEVDSDKRGRNEMEYRSGMEPWMNQSQYLWWVTQKMPQENKPKYTEVSI